MKLLHAADLHIDSPLRGLAAYEGAPVEDLRMACRRALENLVSLARSEAVDAVLLAGDIYDGTWRDYQTGLFFGRQMSSLREAGIPVFLVSGNHDAQNVMTRDLRLPQGVHVLNTAVPQTIRDERVGLAVHGQGFARRDISENLALSYPIPDTGLFNVGLLHTALNGREGHDNYAPCTVEQLAAKGYDYWALGHVHRREEVSRDPWIVFPGNIQGRHARETGSKGCTLVTVDDLHIVSVVHRELDVARWEHLEVNVAGAADTDSASDLVAERLRELADDRLHAVRVTLTGSTPAHLRLWRERERLIGQAQLAANDLGGIWIEKVRLTTRPSASTDDGAAGLIADIRRTATALHADGAAIERLVNSTPLLSSSLPTEARGPGRIDPGDAEWLRRLGDEALELLESMLAEESR